MSLIIVLLIVGVMEVVTIGKLHEIIGTSDLVIFYLGTTAVGATVAWVCYSQVKEVKSRANLSNKLSKRLKAGTLSDKDQKAMTSMLFITTYYLGCVLIAIPGILTDILGILLVLPPINSSISSKWGTKVFEGYYGVKGHSSNK